MMKQNALSLWRNNAVRLILLPWAIAFLILQFANTQDGGPNAVSRFLTLRSMAEKGSFTIDERVGATSDWSVTPAGHYYSNKAPGPMLLGFPAFFVVDQVPRLWEKGFRDEYGLRHVPGYFSKTWTSFFNQIVPLLILMALIVRWLTEVKVSRNTQLYFILAAFFGSTVSMYFNNYSGHAFNAVLQLGMLYALVRGRYGWVGFLAGSALLSDYSFVMQIPAFLAALAVAFAARKEFWKPVGRIVAGSIIPGALWIWYHTAAFGSPFLVANHFQNPIFLDTANEAHNLLGIFRIPRLDILWELLFGSGRGLLVTQPWILFLMPLVFWPFLRKPQASAATDEVSVARQVSAVFSVLSLVGLLIMNSAYGGWQGGGAAGPRYLSGIFLCFAFWIALELDSYPKWLRIGFWLALGVSLLLRAIVYGTTILGPGVDLWKWYIFSEYSRPTWTPQLRFTIFALVMIGTWLIQRKRWKRHEKAVA